MNKNQAFEKLDSARPDSDDLRDPEFADAVRLIESSADDERRFLSRLDFDRNISAAMQDVVVPAGLKEKLLLQTGLGDESADGSSAEDDCENAHEGADVVAASSAADFPDRRKTVGRRTLLISAATLLLAVCGWFLWPAQQIAAAEFLASVPLESNAIQKLSTLDESVAVNMPYASQFRQCYGWSHDGQLSQSVGLFEFRGRTGKRCVLVTIPKQSLADPDALTTATLSVTRTNAFTARGWQMESDTEEFVCVLFIEGTGAELEFEIRNLQGSVS